jgi:mono/diheme cytochrome c family protein
MSGPGQSAAVLFAITLVGVVSAGRAQAGPPRQDYVLHCMGCHREDGSGAPGRVPSLADVGRFLRAPDGRAYLVRVPGTAQAPLDDDSVAALLNWMLRAFDPDGLPEGFAPYTAEEVARHRAVPLADADALRRALLAELEGGR